jgi:glucose uptake protein GlcU
MLSIFAGWLAVFISCLAFGSFAVPMKAPSVLKVNVHPLVFQTYKTFWVFVTSWVTAFWVPVTFTPWGLVSGLSWVPAGVAAVVSVQHVGLGVGQGTWSSVIVLVSFSWGVFYFGEPLYSYPMSVFGLLSLMGGVAGMAHFSTQEETVDVGEKRGSEGRPLVGKYVELGQPSSADEISGRNLLTSAASSNKSGRGTKSYLGCNCFSRWSRRQIGLGAALFNGIWGGSNMVPLRIVQQHSSEERSGSVPSGVGFVISFAVGSALVNLLMWAVLYVHRRFVTGDQMPSLHLKAMVVPGAIAGCLWSLGNVMAMLAVLALGEAVGYSCVQASILVSGLWSIFYYNELTDQRRIKYWLGSAVLALVGIITLSQMIQ